MTAPPGLEPAGDEGVNRATSGGGQDREGRREKAGQGGKRKAGDRHGNAGDRRLPLAADVEQAGMEGDGNREPGEDEVGRVVEREADALGAAERAAQKQRRRLQRILADADDHEPGDEQSRRDRNQRHHRDIGPAWEVDGRGAHPASVTLPAPSSGKKGLWAISQRCPSGSAT